MKFYTAAHNSLFIEREIDKLFKQSFLYTEELTVARERVRNAKMLENEMPIFEVTVEVKEIRGK